MISESSRTGTIRDARRRWLARPGTAALLLWLLCNASPAMAQGGTGDGDGGVLEMPLDFAVCQVAYGDPGELRLSWSNPESFEEIVVFVDGAPVSAYVDGAFGRAAVEASPGNHAFEIEGRVGELTSDPATVSFEVLLESPVTDPVSDLRCEFVPGEGGRLEVSWVPGTGDWVAGEVRLEGGLSGRRRETVEFARDRTDVTIDLGGDRPDSVDVAFKNESGYFSEPVRVSCPQLVPAFRRGDCDLNRRVNIADIIFQLNHLFKLQRRWYCDDACDINDDGQIDLMDPMSLLQYLFSEGTPPGAPGPDDCGADPSADFLGGICRDACV